MLFFIKLSIYENTLKRIDMQNILFLGGAGFIGSNLVHKFALSDNYRIFVFEPIFADINRLSDIVEHITLIRGAISDFNLIKSVIENHKIDIIVHLVSTLVPGSSYKEFKSEFENIVFPTVRIMELCAENSIKFVFFSSGGTVYGNSINGSHFRESDLLYPISYYGLTKQIIESNVLFENRKGGLQYLIIRPSNPFGPGQSLHGNQGFIAVSIGKILGGKPLEVWGDGSCIRDYIYIKDLADSFLKLIDKNVWNEIFNIGSGYGYTINDIIDRLRKSVDMPIEINYKKSRSVDVNSMVLDITKLNSTVDVHHTHLEEGISEFYKYASSLIKYEK